MHAVQTVEALTARRNRANNHALADRVQLLEARSEFINDPNGLMPQEETRLDGIFTANDVHVRSADRRRRRDPDHGLAGTRRRLRHVFDVDAIFPT